MAFLIHQILMRYIDRVKQWNKYLETRKATRGRARYERITKEQIKLIRQMLLGPFIPEWYNNKHQVENTDRAISERLELPFSLVCQCTNKILQDKEYDRLLMREFLECRVCNTMFKTCKKHKYVLNKLVK